MLVAMIGFDVVTERMLVTVFFSVSLQPVTILPDWRVVLEPLELGSLQNITFLSNDSGQAQPQGHLEKNYSNEGWDLRNSPIVKNALDDVVQKKRSIKEAAELCHVSYNKMTALVMERKNLEYKEQKGAKEEKTKKALSAIKHGSKNVNGIAKRCSLTPRQVQNLMKDLQHRKEEAKKAVEQGQTISQAARDHGLTRNELDSFVKKTLKK